ncbi:MAG TPA: carbohydrate-binding family 9-like protein [Ilumatobacteraceae bacterium]|nr:carbohydrate-binding family 9-like protein [Ilumatobacteraceae bacterium]HRB02725.1 carbohydrate-binding family 9-like protein [Ilumatobacteraceae bacterium]
MDDHRAHSNQPDYVAHRINLPIGIDGDVTKPPWAHATWSHRFVDMASGRPGMYDTRAAILWDTTNLYFAVAAEEPFVSAELTERDSIIFQENDLELFIDGGDSYYELEVNAANTVYEVFFIWRDAYTRGSRFDQPQFDVHSPAAFTFGGDYDRTPATFWTGSHPRGTRWAFTNFDMPGLRTAVQVDGTLNDDSDIDSGWSLEVAIPWSSLAFLADGRSVPPQHGDEWRMFLGRFQRLELSGNEVLPHPATALTSHGVYDTHQPDRWSRIRFEH